MRQFSFGKHLIDQNRDNLNPTRTRPEPDLLSCASRRGQLRSLGNLPVVSYWDSAGHLVGPPC